MAEWIIPGNPNKYDVVSAFRELKRIDWTQSVNIASGDIVYIYVTGNVKELRFKCRANKVNLSIPDIDDQKYNISGECDGRAGRYMELELIEELSGSAYSRDELIRHGFQSPMGPIRMPDSIKSYLSTLKGNMDKGINFISVLEYLENNREAPYTNPDAVSDPVEKARMLAVKQKGQDATTEIEKVTALCQQRFGFNKCSIKTSMTFLQFICRTGITENAS